MADKDIAWKRVEPTTVTKVGWRTVVTKAFRMPDGSLKTWDTKEPENSRTVATLAFTPDKKVITAFQYRPGIEDFMYELPGGGVDAGEDLETAARRELYEETGYKPGTMQYLGKARVDAHSNNESNFFLATDCTVDDGSSHSDDEEFIDVRLITIEELFAHAHNALLTDIPALFLAQDQIKKMQEDA